MGDLILMWLRLVCVTKVTKIVKRQCFLIKKLWSKCEVFWWLWHLHTMVMLLALESAQKSITCYLDYGLTIHQTSCTSPILGALVKNNQTDKQQWKPSGRCATESGQHVNTLPWVHWWRKGVLLHRPSACHLAYIDQTPPWRNNTGIQQV